MKPTLLFASVVLLGVGVLNAQPSDYESLKTEAEKFYADGSYAKVNEIYAKVDTSKLKPAERRWVEFRVADTMWRSQAATQTSDPTKYEKAQQQLNVLI